MKFYHSFWLVIKFTDKQKNCFKLLLLFLYLIAVFHLEVEIKKCTSLFVLVQLRVSIFVSFCLSLIWVKFVFFDLIMVSQFLILDLRNSSFRLCLMLMQLNGNWMQLNQVCWIRMRLCSSLNERALFYLNQSCKVVILSCLPTQYLRKIIREIHFLIRENETDFRNKWFQIILFELITFWTNYNTTNFTDSHKHQLKAHCQISTNSFSKSIAHVIKYANFQLYRVHPDGVI